MNKNPVLFIIWIVVGVPICFLISMIETFIPLTKDQVLSIQFATVHIFMIAPMCISLIVLDPLFTPRELETEVVADGFIPLTTYGDSILYHLK